ncbi:hypothetical protein CRE_09411 [Caenorhabditis remanei]|uniref:F-box domain-containing protein n=2 Tax=Caenorhabditis remanei TaxID=31234 RepID=E3LIQ6_CAERE|nr:hypothetical protein CRE_09411 [Caenorhabditis remanei]
MRVSRVSQFFAIFTREFEKCDHLQEREMKERENASICENENILAFTPNKKIKCEYCVCEKCEISRARRALLIACRNTKRFLVFKKQGLLHLPVSLMYLVLPHLPNTSIVCNPTFYSNYPFPPSIPPTEKLAMSLSKFPILKLPVLALNEVLKLLTPFEIIFLSFCSKRTKSICQSIRLVPRRNADSSLGIWFKAIDEIYFQFSFSKFERWAIVLKKRPEPKNTKENRCWSIFTRGLMKLFRSRKSSWKNIAKPIENIYFPYWKTSVIEKEYDLRGDGRFSYTCHLLHVYTSENLLSASKKLADYISEILHEKVYFLTLKQDLYSREENEAIVDLYCQQPIGCFELTWDTSNDPPKNDVLTSILKKQNATRTLDLRINPSSDFTFDFEQFKNSLYSMRIWFSHWITFEQVLEMNTEHLFLTKSNFLQEDFKLIIDEWRDGWNPNWKVLMIEFDEDIDIDECVDGEYINLQPEDWKRKSVIYRNAPIQLNRFEGSIEKSWGTVIRTGYHILRRDAIIASIGIETGRFGWFHIQSDNEDPEVQMMSHYRAFGLE